MAVYKGSDLLATVGATNGIYPYEHSKTGAVHNLIGTGTNIKFKAAADFTTGDTFTVNGSAVTARSIDGSSLSTGDFVTGSEVFAILSGDLLTVVFRSYAGELAGVNSALAEKTNYIVANDLHEIKYDCIARWTKTTLNTPYKDGLTTGTDGLCLISANPSAASLLCMANGRNELFVKRKSTGTWYDWAKVATATKLQEFDLPLEEGLTANCPCQYFKTQDSVVTVILSVTHATELPSVSTIATLPPGFRPITDYYFTGICHPSMQSGLFGITSGGEIKIVSGVLTGGTSLALSCTFVAA